MPNPFFNQFGTRMVPQNNTPFGNLANILNRFNQFKSTFQGDPKQKVQELLNSGQMTEQQFNQLSQLANQFQSLVGKH